MSVFELINEIENGEVVLPAIQRDFVWDEDRVEKLLDSLFRGYPVGIVLLWETYQKVQFRPFVKDHTRDFVHIFEENKQGQRLKLVLDGQQRLSSLYVALKGTYSRRKLFFDVLSGRDADNHADVKYRFKFDTEKNVKMSNDQSKKAASPAAEHWINLSDIIGKHPRDAMIMKNNLAAELSLDETDKLRLDLNIQTAVYALTENSEILKTQTIDNKLPADDQRRKSAFDVLEIFVRINTQGIILRRSDLIVSMMRLYWQDASNIIPEFLSEINKEHNLQIDNDFVIRCMFSTAGIGTRLDFEILRKQSNVDKVKAAQPRCFDAIRSTLDFIRSECGIDAARLLGGLGTLVPLVHYLFHAPGHVFDRSNQMDVKRSVYLFAFSKVFSQYAESRTATYVRDYLPKDQEISRGSPFSIGSAISFVSYKGGYYAADEHLFNNNVELALSVLQGKAGGKVYFDSNRPEIDHIFPKSVLYEKGVEAKEVNSLGNLWILPRGFNRNKSAKHPRDFLKEVDDKILEISCIDRQQLDYRSYRSFVRERLALVTGKLVQRTGLSPRYFSELETEDSLLPE